ncbi:hypothetical protein AAVH_25484 [Aphelenchoides avenae]|nr:hypothetical protein AAVH_25484 [Aphelenchus avenae]
MCELMLIVQFFSLASSKSCGGKCKRDGETDHTQRDWSEFTTAIVARQLRPDQNSTTPLSVFIDPFHSITWNGHAYYWDRWRFPKTSTADTICTLPNAIRDKKPFVTPDGYNVTVTFGGTSPRPREIVWGCSIEAECCGLRCCKSETDNTIWILMAAGFVVLSLLLIGLFRGRNSVL